MNWLRIWERILAIQHIFSSKVGRGCYSYRYIPQVFSIPPTLPLINRFRKLWPVRFRSGNVVLKTSHVPFSIESWSWIGGKAIRIYGCFRKWWYPQNTPKRSFLVGKPMVVGYHHLRKPPYQHINTLSILKMPPHLCSSAVLNAFVISIIIEPYRYPWGFNHESPRHPTNAHRPDRYPHHTSQSPGSFKISHPHTFFRITGTWTVEQCLSLSTKTNPSSFSSFISKACRPHCNDVLLPGRPK